LKQDIILSNIQRLILLVEGTVFRHTATPTSFNAAQSFELYSEQVTMAQLRMNWKRTWQKAGGLL